MSKATLPRKDLFDLPEGVLYLDGNSLGPLPRGAVERVGNVMRNEWGAELIKAWNSAGWMDLPRVVGDRIGELVGAPAGSVATGDTLSIKVYQALAAALKMRPGRKVILSDNGNFPSDLYMAEGLVGLLGQGYELRAPDPEAVAEAITGEVAVVMLTHVDYRTGRMHDMEGITRLAHDAGAVMIWDLAHSAGAVPVDLAASNCEFAVGCSYKYLNGGPGAPAFIYVAPRHANMARPALSGCWAMPRLLRSNRPTAPETASLRMRVGTPPVLALATLETALDIWTAWTWPRCAPVHRRCPNASSRGRGHLPDAGPRLAARSRSARQPGVVPVRPRVRGNAGLYRPWRDRRFPCADIMRFGITPLYIDEADIDRAATVIARIMEQRLWDDAAYRARAAVT